MVESPRLSPFKTNCSVCKISSLLKTMLKSTLSHVNKRFPAFYHNLLIFFQWRILWQMSFFLWKWWDWWILNDARLNLDLTRCQFVFSNLRRSSFGNFQFTCIISSQLFLLQISIIHVENFLDKNFLISLKIFSGLFSRFLKFTIT